MRQPYWNLAWNLWALALSTVIALFLPDFGPAERMAGGVGVVIRTTMVAPVVFTLLYWAGWLALRLGNRLKRRWPMSTFFAGIEDGIRSEAEKRAREIVDTAVESAAKAAAERAAQAIQTAQENSEEAIRAAQEDSREAIRDAQESIRAAQEDAQESIRAAQEDAQESIRVAQEDAQESIRAAQEDAQESVRAEAEKAAAARDAERERVRRFMRVQGLSEEQIDAFFRQLSGQD